MYGLGAHAFDTHALARIFEIKRRPTFDPLIVHVYDGRMLRQVVRDVPPRARALIDAFWPGPLTIVLGKTERVPSLATSDLPTVAVRMPAHPVARALLERVGVPLAAPSANPFGYLSPTRAHHVSDAFGDAVPLVIDGGATDVGIESTIVMLEPRPVLLRPGAIPREAVENVIGALASEHDDASRPLAPGRLPQHYAPRTPIELFDDAPRGDRSGAALLAFAQALPGYAHVRVLSESGDVREAAANVFEALHELDASGAVRIDAQRVPMHGLGVAINDRLERAARKASDATPTEAH